MEPSFNQHPFVEMPGTVLSAQDAATGQENKQCSGIKQRKTVSKYRKCRRAVMQATKTKHREGWGCSLSWRGQESHENIWGNIVQEGTAGAMVLGQKQVVQRRHHGFTV